MCKCNETYKIREKFIRKECRRGRRYREEYSYSRSKTQWVVKVGPVYFGLILSIVFSDPLLGLRVFSFKREVDRVKSVMTINNSLLSVQRSHVED